MRDRPSGAELLWQAREVLLRELMEHLPENKRYDGLMIGAAMAIAARELESGDAPLRRWHAALSGLYGESEDPPGDREALQEELLRLETQLVQEIRDGARDGEGYLHALLQELTRDKLRESNPKALKT